MSSNSIGVKEWRKRFKQKIVDSFGGKCGLCGYNRCNEVFHCHHLNPTEKLFSISKVMAAPKKWEIVVPELRKCAMLCSNCHGEVHAGLILVPADIRRFDESFAVEPERQKNLIPCPICEALMPDHQKTCSLTCAGRKAWKVKWDTVDLHDLYIVKQIPQLKIASLLGCSGSAVRKKLNKLNLIPRYAN